ncbi:MipA/OmpV family protein [Kordiimonas marina]|uniref:MipA/OmpV family protein n=1 Tax=Kordiimonas marina TaxID=2872312 RepID=UPI00248CDAFD|nr:MipA/OmpV family protein [Kordiimonas marina]
MTLASRSPFAGDGTYMRVLPALSYRSKHVFLEGLQAGYRLFPWEDASTRPRLTLDLIAALRLQPGAERKKASLDAGLRLSYRLKPASLSVTFRQDVSGVHGGEEVGVKLSKRFRTGDFTFIPALEAEWQSRALANHLWGTTASQHQSALEDGYGGALPVYKLDTSVLNYGASLLSIYQFDKRWSLTGLFKARYLDHSVMDNPGIVHRLDLKAGLGLSYRF